MTDSTHHSIRERAHRVTHSASVQSTYLPGLLPRSRALATRFEPPRDLARAAHHAAKTTLRRQSLSTRIRPSQSIARPGRTGTETS